MHLTDLPPELLVLLPNYLYSLDDWYALIRTSRCFYSLCTETHATFPPVFAKEYGQHILPPHPLLLLAGTVRHVGDWAVKSDENQKKLWEAIRCGNEGLLELATDVARISVPDVRALVRAKYSVFNPLVRTLDFEIGQGQRKRYDEHEVRGKMGKRYEMLEDGGVKEQDSRLTVCEDVETALYSYWIYCELFHHNVDACYLPSLPHGTDQPKPLSAQMRHHWMFHCMPDLNSVGPHCELEPNCEAPAEQGTEFRLVDFWQFHDSSSWNYSTLFELLLDKPQDPGSYYGGPTKGVSQKDVLFVRIMEHQGLQTMKLLLPGGLRATEDYWRGVKKMIEKLPDERVDNEARYADTAEGLRHVGWHCMLQDTMCCMGSD